MLESGGSVQACLVHLLSHWEVGGRGVGVGRVHPSIPARRSQGLGFRGWRTCCVGAHPLVVGPRLSAGLCTTLQLGWGRDVFVPDFTWSLAMTSSLSTMDGLSLAPS